MSKELPYFRFTAFEWLNDDISLEDYSIKGLFTDVCAYYWFKDCSLTMARLEQRFPQATEGLQRLLEIKIIKQKENSEFIEISFLNQQYDQLSERRKRLQAGGSKGGTQRAINDQARLKQGLKPDSSDKDKDKDNDKENEFIMSGISTLESNLKEDKKPSVKERNLNFIPLAERLKEIVQTNKKVTIPDKYIKSWANQIRLLSEEFNINRGRIEVVLDRYARYGNTNGQYDFVIESGSSLREKFLKLEVAMEKHRNLKNNKPKQNGIGHREKSKEYKIDGEI